MEGPIKAMSFLSRNEFIMSRNCKRVLVVVEKYGTCCREGRSLLDMMASIPIPFEQRGVSECD